MNTLELADFLTAHAKKATTRFTCNESPFTRAAAELRRLSAIEQAATAMFNSNSHDGIKQNIKNLVAALGLQFPLPDFPPQCAEQSTAGEAPSIITYGHLIPKGIYGLTSQNTGAEIYTADPRPSAFELQDAEVGIPDPVTELINPA